MDHMCISGIETSYLSQTKYSKRIKCDAFIKGTGRDLT